MACLRFGAVADGRTAVSRRNDHFTHLRYLNAGGGSVKLRFYARGMTMRRALFLVTAVSALMAGGIAAASAQANLDAGKSPAQIFAHGCSACHRSP